MYRYKKAPLGGYSIQCFDGVLWRHMWFAKDLAAARLDVKLLRDDYKKKAVANS